MPLLFIVFFYVLPSIVALRIIYGLAIKVIFSKRPIEARSSLNPWVGGIVLGIGFFVF
jgi:hypothetical protein